MLWKLSMNSSLSDFIAYQGIVRATLIAMIIASLFIEIALCLRQIQHKRINLSPLIFLTIYNTLIFIIFYVIISVMAGMQGISVGQPELHSLMLLFDLMRETLPWVLAGVVIVFIQIWIGSIVVFLRDRKN